MAITRNRKEELVAEYTRQLAQSQGVLMAHYAALTVAQMETLRRRVREQHGEVFVIKNTLFELTLAQQGIKTPAEAFGGPILVAFCHKDVPHMAKLFREFTKEMEEGRFRIWGALLEKQFYPAQQAATLADMPGREVLMAQVLGAINAPATQVAGVIAGGIRQIMNVVQAYVDKMKDAGAPVETAAA